MYAVIKTGGKQYRVAEGDVLALERLEGEKGSTITFDHVLAIGGGDGLKLGKPTLEGAKVEAEVLAQGRAKKVIVFKFKRRKGYKRTKGHRQYFTRVRVKSITA
jgi:large subunit ribosomal protein L21